MPVEQTAGAKTSIRSRLLADVQDKRLELPTLPESNARIEMIAEGAGINVRELIDALGHDPGVAAQLMRIANSPPYAGANPVGSLGVAIRQLGLRYAAELAAGLSSRLVFQPTNEMIERRYRMAVADATFVGAAAAVFARNYTEISAERARLAGLTHNLGIFPILAQAEYENFTDTFALGKIVDAAQVALGAAILQNWNFPVEVVELPRRLRDHHRANAQPELLDLIAVAVQLNLYFNHSDSLEKFAGNIRPNGKPASVESVSTVRPGMSQSLAMMIYEIAGFDPISNAGQVAKLREEISAELPTKTDV